MQSMRTACLLYLRIAMGYCQTLSARRMRAGCRTAVLGKTLNQTGVLRRVDQDGNGSPRDQNRLPVMVHIVLRDTRLARKIH